MLESVIHPKEEVEIFVEFKTAKTSPASVKISEKLLKLKVPYFKNTWTKLMENIETSPKEFIFEDATEETFKYLKSFVQNEPLKNIPMEEKFKCLQLAQFLCIIALEWEILNSLTWKSNCLQEAFIQSESVLNLNARNMFCILRKIQKLPGIFSQPVLQKVSKWAERKVAATSSVESILQLLDLSKLDASSLLQLQKVNLVSEELGVKTSLSNFHTNSHKVTVLIFSGNEKASIPYVGPEKSILVYGCSFQSGFPLRSFVGDYADVLGAFADVEKFHWRETFSVEEKLSTLTGSSQYAIAPYLDFYCSGSEFKIELEDEKVFQQKLEWDVELEPFVFVVIPGDDILPVNQMLMKKNYSKKKPRYVPRDKTFYVIFWRLSQAFQIEVFISTCKI
eukprot:snap_masked-scaffold_26-processed-gene-0.20-mRNA-1 protein AED:1.00 eAED:1.00 QI:0/0/0/0/1/1/3/0/392